ncbi:hypothetical protein [Flavobacterium soyangense]|uniref:Uncharacterized protein n=1 Tax=Flavobacterium soyangense TaxID=2023265 RepID=A0A930UBL8_9FLAO|nr:hypothetical protein [Flavobacterium soyangense]MBF2707380.1 hypothetical protein [Flavobacterium soyangense]
MLDKTSLPSIEWWAKQRIKYNKGLMISGILSFICYAILGEFLILPYNKEYEITLFTILFQAIGFLMMIGIANTFYNLGHWSDKNFNKNNSEKFRKRLFNCGFWFSCGLPFLIPIMTVVVYFVEYKK